MPRIGRRLMIAVRCCYSSPGLAFARKAPLNPRLRPSRAPNLIIVRRFATARRIVALDPSLGFSLQRGHAGVPPAERAASIARATTFILADTITQQLHDKL